jgi:hypothetical protein
MIKCNQLFSKYIDIIVVGICRSCTSTTCACLSQMVITPHIFWIDFQALLSSLLRATYFANLILLRVITVILHVKTQIMSTLVM